MAYHLLENRFLQFVRKERLVKDGDHVLLAYSGGLDSSVLLHLLCRVHIPVSAAHCNFGLRAEESDMDEAFCEEECRRLQIPFTSRHFNTEHHARSKGISIQMAARELRYGWFRDLMSVHGYPLLATAHHRGDQAETVLLNLIDGRSFEAMRGIPVRNGSTIRPILHFGKDELLEYALDKKIKWREDSSNSGVEYRRNMVRHRIIPLLKTLNPSVEDTLFRFADRLEGWNRLAQEETDRLTAGLTEEVNGSFTIRTGSIHEHPALDILLWKLLSPFGFSGPQIDDIRSAIDQTGTVFTSSTFRLHVDRGRLIIEPIRQDPAPGEWVLTDSAGRIENMYFSMEASILDRTEEKLSIPGDPNTAWLDARTVAFPLTIGRWTEGERFQPLGMEHSKKLSDYFIDRKIPIPEKERKWVVRSSNRVVWLAGERIDHRFRVKEDTEKILVLKFTAK